MNQGKRYEYMKNLKRLLTGKTTYYLLKKRGCVKRELP